MTAPRESSAQVGANRLKTSIFSFQRPRRQLCWPLWVALDDGRGRFQALAPLQGVPHFRCKSFRLSAYRLAKANVTSARARFLARPRQRTLLKPHSCLMMRNGCSPRARARERLRLILVVAERLVRLGAAVHPVAHAGFFGTVAMKLAPVSLIAEHYLLLTVQQLRQLLDIGPPHAWRSRCARCRGHQCQCATSCQSAIRCPCRSAASPDPAPSLCTCSTAERQ